MLGSSFIPRRYFLVYDCRDLNGVYLGRIVIVHTNDFDLGMHEVRNYLDNDPCLKNACTWRVKEVDFSLVADFMEEC